MFLDIQKLSDEQLLSEIKDLEELISLSDKVTIESILNKEVDTNILKKYNFTLLPNGEFFDISRQGFASEIMDHMFQKRQEYKKKMIQSEKDLEKEIDMDRRNIIKKKISRYHNLQLAKKVCLNSYYGSTGNQYFRFFDIRLAISVTTSGQVAIRWIADRINSYLNKLLKTNNIDFVIASDTDSIYLKLDGLVNEIMPNADTKNIIRFMDKICDQKIQPFITKCYEELSAYTNAYAQKMQMKRESLCDKAIWTAKKRYILNVYNNEGVEYVKPKIKVMGLEMVKSSTPSACRIKLEESLPIILNGTEKDVINFIDDFRNKFSTLPVSDVAFPRGVNGMTKYKGKGKAIFDSGTPIHVRGSLIYNNQLIKHKLTKEYEQIKEGEKIKFIYMKEPNPIQSNVISFHDGLPNEFGLDKYVDYDVQFQKSFLDPLKIILDSIGWRTEITSSLEDFFS